jgi:hypothetical protein
MTVSPSRQRGRSADEVEEFLMQIRGLVFVRAILEQRGASASEFDEHRAAAAPPRPRGGR